MGALQISRNHVHTIMPYLICGLEASSLGQDLQDLQDFLMKAPRGSSRILKIRDEPLNPPVNPLPRFSARGSAAADRDELFPSIPLILSKTSDAHCSRRSETPCALRGVSRHRTLPPARNDRGASSPSAARAPVGDWAPFPNIVQNSMSAIDGAFLPFFKLSMFGRSENPTKIAPGSGRGEGSDRNSYRDFGTIHPHGNATSSASNGRALPAFNTTPRTKDALRLMESRKARIPAASLALT